MRIAVGLGKENVEARLERQGVSRRDFLKFCSMVAVTMGMGTGFAEQVARALTCPARPSVVYLHNAECTGCSEALLRTGQPFIDELILDTISLDYHETIMAAAGEAAEAALEQAIPLPKASSASWKGPSPRRMKANTATSPGIPCSTSAAASSPRPRPWSPTAPVPRSAACRRPSPTHPARWASTNASARRASRPSTSAAAPRTR